MKKITSFTHHTTAEGERISYTFSEIDDSGKIIKSNERRTLIAIRDKELEAIRTINEFLLEKVENE